MFGTLGNPKLSAFGEVLREGSWVFGLGAT